MDIELSKDLATATSISYTLEKPDGTGSMQLGSLYSTAGNFFANTPSLAKLQMPAIAAGAYVVRAKGQIVDFSTSTSTYVEATLPIELNSLSPDLLTLSYASGIVYRGSSRLLPFSYSSLASGTLYIYPTGRPSDVCGSKTAAELAAMPDVSTYAVTGSAIYFSQTYASGALFADADTACLQFVRSGDAVAEAPFTYNLRYQALPASGDLLLALDADASAVNKTALSLLSLPLATNVGGMYDWLNRRELFTAGDVVQQSTPTSARITLEQANGAWQYRTAAPVATDPPFFVAKVEGRPPLVFFVAH